MTRLWSWWWWHKHFHIIFLFVFLISLQSIGFTTAGTGIEDEEEPTEEPEETVHFSNNSEIPTSTLISTSSTSVEIDTSDFENSSDSIDDDDDSSAVEIENDSDISISDIIQNVNETETAREKQDHYDPRASLRSSGSLVNWKTAGWMLTRGLRMFRESLLEGAKVAHMFKEDLDEGMSSIMRQNRGVKPDPESHNDNNAGSAGSIFDSQILREGVLGGVLRFMGINSKQMGVIALNVLIILAEWITSSMIGNDKVAGATSRMIKTNLLQWASTGHNRQVEKLLSQAKSHSLPEKLIDTLSAKTGNSTSCVQLLICKMTPVIWGLQDTVKEQMVDFGFEEEPKLRTAPTTPSTTSTTSQAPDGKSYDDDDDEPNNSILATSQHLINKFLDHLPPTDRMVDFGDRCETKFPNCQLLKFDAVKQL